MLLSIKIPKTEYQIRHREASRKMHEMSQALLAPFKVCLYVEHLVKPIFEGIKMSCIKKCPHHVRHGKANAMGKIEFRTMCGLLMKEIGEKVKKESLDCTEYPFHDKFESTLCPIYKEVFHTPDSKNSVNPTKDINFNDSISSGSITDMELI